ncbi:MAG: ABC-type transport system substrate-binding protein [Patiriisocius sp.]
MKRKNISLIVFLVIIVQCTPPQKDHGKSVFYYNEAEGITNLDPAFASNYENIWWVSQIFNGLVQMDDNLNIIPCIAKGWSISEDGLKYTFMLREDVYFQDNKCFKGHKGRLVKASDFSYSFSRILDKSVASPGIWIFSHLDKENPFLAPDDTTFIVNLKQNFTPFLSMLSMPYCNVVPHEALTTYGPDFRENPVGTGPFTFNFWIDNSRLSLLKNNNYFEKDENGNNLPYLDAISVSFVKDRSNMFLDFLKGEYDMISSLHPAYKDQLLNEDGTLSEVYADRYYLLKQPYLKTDYLGILVDDSLSLSTNSPLANKKVRQAMSCAINKESMVRYIRNNTCSAANSGFVPKGLSSFNENLKSYEYDPQRARDLLSEAGYPDGLKDIRLSTTSAYVELCQFVQHEFEQVGIELSIDVLPTSNHRQGVANSNIMFFRKSWIADYPDSENFLALFYSKNYSPKGANYTHYKNDLYDRLYEESIIERDPVERNKLYQSMDSMIVEDVPLIPLLYDQVVRFVSKDIEGLESDGMNSLKLKRVRKVISEI